MNCSRANASAVAAWLFSSSSTMPRQPSEEIDFGPLEVPQCERRLAGSGRTDHHHEAELGDRYLHEGARSKMAICEGAPRLSSSAPTGSIVAVYPNRLAMPSVHTRNSFRVHSKR